MLAFVARSYSIMDDKKYSRVRSSYKRLAFQIQEKWEDYFYNAVGQAIAHSDPSHLSDVIAASRELHQYRNVSRVIRAMKMPWDMSYMEHPKGDVPKANKTRLNYLRVNWQNEFADAMNHLEVEVQKSIDLPVDQWWEKKATATILHMVKTAKAKGMSKADLKDHIVELINKAA